MGSVVEPFEGLVTLLDRAGAQGAETLKGVTLAEWVASPEPPLVQLSVPLPAS